MNTKEYKKNLVKLGMTQRDLSIKLNVTEKTINSTINSEIIPLVYVYALKAIMIEEGK